MNQLNLPKISIIIPAYNRKNDVLECLTSVMDLDYLRYEVIVVDNGSTDKIYQTIKKVFPKVKVIRSDKNLGVTGGRNLGLKYINSDSEYVLFLDQDIIVDKDVLSRFLEVVMKNSKIGIATPKICYYHNRNKIWSVGTSISLFTGKVSFNGANQIDRGQFDRVMDVQVAPATILVRRQVIKKIGGFDEVYFATYEDTDFCFRARKSGYRVVCIPQAKVYHKISQNLSDSVNRLLSRAYYVGRNRIIFMKKHSNHFVLFLMFLPIYTIYYTGLSLCFGRVDGIRNFWKGTIIGLSFIIGNEGM